MKIDRIEAFAIGNPWKNWILVKVTSDAGHVGWGEATTGLTTQPAMGALGEIARLFLGRDPRAIQANWMDAHKALYLSGDGVILAAMAGIETACWDIVGKELGLPLYRLLGGLAQPRIRTYANGWYQAERDPARFAERTRAVAAKGYSALKFDPFGHNFRTLDRAERAKTLALVEAVRAALPDDVDIILEFHDRLTPLEALSVARDVARFRPLWIEDPTWSEDVPALARVARDSPVRVAAGERFKTLGKFAELFALGGVDMVLPEYLSLGGLWRMKEAAAVAAAHGALVSPHNAQSPLSTALNVHFDIATHNAFIQECFDDFHVEWADEIFSGYPRIADGCLAPSEAPGHGVSVNEAAFAKHPYGARNFMNMFSAGWEKRNS
ncbi:MAG: mandelate racemase/muconate lactonizing enzyme family protein [Acetobacteraceae bacterium]|nr:mandelate racemase/muconate lactonizing enzyme family protein [Acetobacteraceae bacterium]